MVFVLFLVVVGLILSNTKVTMQSGKVYNGLGKPLPPDVSWLRKIPPMPYSQSRETPTKPMPSDWNLTDDDDVYWGTDGQWHRF